MCGGRLLWEVKTSQHGHNCPSSTQLCCPALSFQPLCFSETLEMKMCFKHIQYNSLFILDIGNWRLCKCFCGHFPKVDQFQCWIHFSSLIISKTGRTFKDSGIQNCLHLMCCGEDEFCGPHYDLSWPSLSSISICISDLRDLFFVDIFIFHLHFNICSSFFAHLWFHCLFPLVVVCVSHFVFLIRLWLIFTLMIISLVSVVFLKEINAWDEQRFVISIMVFFTNYCFYLVVKTY